MNRVRHLDAEWILDFGNLRSSCSLLLGGIGKGWICWKGGRGIAHLTAFHDFQPKDKHEGIEVIVEQETGKQWEEHESGEEKDKMNHDT